MARVVVRRQRPVRGWDCAVGGPHPDMRSRAWHTGPQAAAVAHEPRARATTTAGLQAPHGQRLERRARGCRKWQRQAHGCGCGAGLEAQSKERQRIKAGVAECEVGRPLRPPVHPHKCPLQEVAHAARRVLVSVAKLAHARVVLEAAHEEEPGGGGASCSSSSRAWCSSCSFAGGMLRPQAASGSTVARGRGGDGFGRRAACRRGGCSSVACDRSWSDSSSGGGCSGRAACGRGGCSVVACERVCEWGDISVSRINSHQSCAASPQRSGNAARRLLGGACSLRGTERAPREDAGRPRREWGQQRLHCSQGSSR